MKYLLDTHTFLWWCGNPSLLSQPVVNILNSPDSQLSLSLASIWEIQIKLQLGKLTLDDPLDLIVELQSTQNDLKIVPITFDHILGLSALPLIHKDPFDRILISQSRIENSILISRDTDFRKYDSVQVLW